MAAKSEKGKRDAIDNVMDQINAVKNRINIRSFKTVHTYYGHTSLFAKYYVEEWHRQKFVNVSGKHIRGYVKKMQEQGLSPSTIKARLSGIRFFYEQAGGKNRLPDNNELGLEKRQTGKVNIAWLPQEISKGIECAELGGRMDAKYAIKLGSEFGLRIEELCRVRLDHIIKAMRYGEITVQGKGGQVRAVPIKTAEQKALIEELHNFAKKNKIQPVEYLISPPGKHGVRKEMKSLENWLTAHRDKFTVANRTDFVKSGDKPRSTTLTWHGLRYYYAQNEHQRNLDAGVKRAKYKTSETLGHHRPDITNTYLSRAPTKVKKQH